VTAMLQTSPEDQDKISPSASTTLYRQV